jgi:hypothetical protein
MLKASEFSTKFHNESIKAETRHELDCEATLCVLCGENLIAEIAKGLRMFVCL